MTCEEALLAISAALDGELPPMERARLSEHLVACESCRELAEDLRVLTDALEDSDREPPAGLAESVRKAVEEEPQPVPAPKKRRPPYLRSLAAMVALCVGLGAIGLFAAGRGGGETGSADNGAAPALYQAPQASQAPQTSQAAPEAIEKYAAAGCDGSAEESNGTARYSATEGGDPAEAPMEEADAEVPQLAPADAPVPSSALAPNAAVGTYNSGGGTEEVTPDSGPDGAGPSSDRMEGEGKLAITPEEALERVFEHLGGYESFPDAEITEMPFQFTATQVYPPSMCLIPDHATESGGENDQHSSTWITYFGLSPNSRYHVFWLFSYLTFPGFDFNRGSTLDFIAVSLDGSEILEKGSYDVWQSYFDAINN